MGGLRVAREADGVAVGVGVVGDHVDHRCGVRRRGDDVGDRVGLWSPNRYEWVLVQFATARIGVIMSLAVGALTGIATRDPGLTLFALLSAMSPIPFVSSISARGDLRKAIVYTALALTPLAAAISWFFSGPETVAGAALYGFLNGFLSGLVGAGFGAFVGVPALRLKHLYLAIATLSLGISYSQL